MQEFVMCLLLLIWSYPIAEAMFGISWEGSFQLVEQSLKQSYFEFYITIIFVQHTSKKNIVGAHSAHAGVRAV